MKKRSYWKIAFLLLAVLVSLTGWKSGVSAAPIRPSEVTSPSSGNVLIGVDGTYYSPNRQAIINRINVIRKEAYDAGYVDRYVPIKWSRELEVAARTRAAESLLTIGHKRLTSKGWSTPSSLIASENLAWNNTNGSDSFMEAIEQWYDEKADYIKYKAGQPHGVIGHYVSMIDPDYVYMGLGSFDIEPEKWTAVAQLFAWDGSGIDQSGEEFNGAVTQVLEATMGDISNLKMHGLPTTLTSPVTLSLTGTLTSSQANPSRIQAYRPWVYPTLEVSIRSSIVWTSSQPSVARIDANGVLTPVGFGKTIITATVGNQQVSREVTIKGITNLETGFTRSIKSGDAVSLPSTVRTTWSDGTTTQEPVTWSSADMTNLTTTPKSVTLVGRVNGTQLTSQTTVTIHGIKTVPSINRSIRSGQSAQLPATLQVTWTDGTTTQEPVTWSAVNTTNTTNQAITTSATGRLSRTNLTAKATITVHGVKAIRPVKVAIKSGQTLQLPATVRATWTNGTATQEPVTWSNVETTNRTNKAVTTSVTGRLTQTNMKAQATVTIHGIRSFDPITVSTKSGIAPTLPKTARALWTDGTSSTEPITWNTVSASSYTVSSPTSFVVSGRSTKTQTQARVTVQVATIKTIPTVSVTTYSGRAPILPTQVNVIWSDGSRSTVPVSWNALKPSQYQVNQLTSFVLRGKVQGTTVPAKVQVRVEAIASIQPVNVTATNNQAPVLPSRVTVTWTNGQTSQEPVVWNPIPTSLYQNLIVNSQFTVNGRLAQTTLPAVANVQVIAQTVPLYRLYHPGIRVHLYTKDLDEYTVLGTRGWNQEGLAWHTAAAQGDRVYRLYHPGMKVHLYTKDLDEYAVLGSRGWNQEGFAFNSYGSVPIYRLYHPGVKRHLYTKDKSEYDDLATRGWNQEGIAFYAVK